MDADGRGGGGRGAQSGRSCGTWALPRQPRPTASAQDTPGCWPDMSLRPVCLIVRLFKTLT